MNLVTLPYLIEAPDLEIIRNNANLLIIDLGTQEQYGQQHIPGAVHFDIELLKLGHKPAPGLLPSIDNLSKALNSIGIEQFSQVVCYDHDNGASAARLMWTLELVQHSRFSMINGGMTAWLASSLPIETEIIQGKSSTQKYTLDRSVLAEKSDVLKAIQNNNPVILDVRSKEEFNGEKSPSDRKGHIPGAVNIDWQNMIDQNNSKKLKSAQDIQNLLLQAGITKDSEVILHCQTHMRSSHSFVVLRSLGYKKIKGYAGSWSEWASDAELPIV